MRKFRVMIVILLTIVLMIPIPFQVKSVGYGEENENLGQFTDDFENDDNVSVAVNVINNQTLDCMELNLTVSGPIPVLENYTDYTEVDIPANRIVIHNDTYVEHLARRNEDTYLYYDYGVDYFDDFTHDFTFEAAYDVAGSLGNPYVLSQTYVDDVLGIFQRANEKSIDIRLYRHTTLGNQFILYYFSGGGGVGDSDTWNGPASNTLYYVRIVKNGAALNLGVYSTEALRDAGNGADGDEANLNLNLGSDLKFRYIFAVNTWNDGGSQSMNYDVRNLDIGRMGAGGWVYADEGYFLTEDYLNYTTGNSLTLLTNTSIPHGTSITVAFSDDNSTWVFNDWEPIFGGFEAIDLRILDYSDFYMRYNFSTSNPTITPRLYQSRLITTIGNVTIIEQNVTGEWNYYNITSINVNVGTHDAGNLASTFVVDGNTYDISEVVGVPGWDIRFNWTNVDQDANSMWVVIYSFYSGNQAHDIDLQLYNFTSTLWTDIEHIEDMIGFEWTNASIYDLRIPNDFINSTGSVLGRIYHADAGNMNHDILIDLIRLHTFIPFEQECPPTPTPTNGVADNTWIIFLAIGLIFMLSIAFLYVKNK